VARESETVARCAPQLHRYTRDQLSHPDSQPNPDPAPRSEPRTLTERPLWSLVPVGPWTSGQPVLRPLASETLNHSMLHLRRWFCALRSP
jgi:hypothetical protein